jgi:hypothetical protein
LDPNFLAKDFPAAQTARGASPAQFCLQNIVITFLTVLEPGGDGFFRLCTAYDLEIFSALSKWIFLFHCRGGFGYGFEAVVGD